MNMLGRGYISALLLLAVGSNVVNGNAAGAPTAACAELQPDTGAHGTASNDASPYAVAVASTNYDSDDITITVTATATELKGIICQVRKTDSTPVGTFAVGDATNYQVRECTNAMDSVTHSNGNDKGTSATFTWTPPGGDMGVLKATCTFVEDRPGNYWLREEAPMMTYMMDDDSSMESDEDAASSLYGHALLSMVLALAAFLLR